MLPHVQRTGSDTAARRGRPDRAARRAAGPHQQAGAARVRRPLRPERAAGKEIDAALCSTKKDPGPRHRCNIRAHQGMTMFTRREVPTGAAMAAVPTVPALAQVRTSDIDKLPRQEVALRARQSAQPRISRWRDRAVLGAASDYAVSGRGCRKRVERGGVNDRDVAAAAQWTRLCLAHNPTTWPTTATAVN